jgi:hypothetical protein
VALQGVSQLAAGQAGDAAAAEALTLQLRRYGYFALCSVFAVVMWQLAASIPGGRGEGIVHVGGWGWGGACWHLTWDVLAAVLHQDAVDMQ